MSVKIKYGMSSSYYIIHYFLLKTVAVRIIFNNGKLVDLARFTIRPICLRIRKEIVKLH